jgi:hypothetical protein
MRTRLVPTVSAGTLPAQVIGSGFPALVPTSHVPKDSATMTISMYKASAPIFVQFLTSLSAVLDKAAAHAEAKKIDPAVAAECVEDGCRNVCITGPVAASTVMRISTNS